MEKSKVQFIGPTRNSHFDSSLRYTCKKQCIGLIYRVSLVPKAPPHPQNQLTFEDILINNWASGYVYNDERRGGRGVFVH